MGKSRAKEACTKCLGSKTYTDPMSGVHPCPPCGGTGVIEHADEVMRCIDGLFGRLVSAGHVEDRVEKSYRKASRRKRIDILSSVLAGLSGPKR